MQYYPDEDELLVRWEGYLSREDWTQEPPSDLWYFIMAQFFYEKQQPVPAHLHTFGARRRACS